MENVLKKLLFILFTFFITNTSYGFDLDSDISSQLSSNLGQLAPFEDIVVIQRRFLQKTGRFEIAPSTSVFFSSEFFFKLGLGANLGFYFLEKHGIEIKGFYLLQVDREVAIDVYKKLQITAASTGVNTVGFIGLIYKWTPIYGKMAFLNRKIVPFDFSFYAGGGVSQVTKCHSIKVNPLGVFCEQENRWMEPTLSFGISQSYALSRNSAIRMDIGVQYYGGLLFSQTIESNRHYWDTYASLAFNFYFPKRMVR